jgi:pyrimidine operon attenuation protein/uracil phosphoribosyltransferase
LDITLSRLAYQLVENYKSLKDIVFIGIQPRGIKISEIIVEKIRTIHPNERLQYGKLDITFYRDDVREEFHKANDTSISFSIEGKTVVLIDDVLYTGRTIRAALDALQDFGRPSNVELCVLINRRFSRQLPIQADYCGKSIDSTPMQKVKVEWNDQQVILY